jgi:UDP-N-acetylglucosamine:LPS N-acetylglucosamine transferase
MSCDVSAPTFSAQTLREIERDLGEVRFIDLPVAAMVINPLIVQLFEGKGRWGFRKALQSALLRLRFARPSSSGPQGGGVSPRPILSTLINDSARVRELILPVWRELGAGRVGVVCPNGAFAKSLEARGTDVTVAVWPEVRSFDVPAWRTEYRRVRPQWLRVLRSLKRRLGLPRGFVTSVDAALTRRTQDLLAARRMLREAAPKAVLVEYDKNPFAAAIVLAARSLEIPTFTLVHGVVDGNAVGFVPSLADRVLCWGELDREKFIANGDPPEKLTPLGCPRIDRELPVSQRQGRQAMGLDPDRPVVLLGTSPYAKEICLRLAEGFCEAVSGLGEAVQPVVRLHPSESLATYEPIRNRFPGVRFLSNADCTLDETLAASDVVVVFSSGLGGDALIKRRLTAVMNVPGGKLRFGEELIGQAGCPRADTPEQLREILQQMLADTPLRRACEQSRETYVRRFCAAFGPDAARRIAEFVCGKAGLEMPS